MSFKMVSRRFLCFIFLLIVYPKSSFTSFLGTIGAIDYSDDMISCKKNERYVATSDGYRCECIPGYVKEGDDCILKETCEESPCLNGGMCIDGQKRLYCSCPLGYLGRICEIRVPECQDASCMDDEFCVSTETGYKCIKKDGIIPTLNYR